MHTHFPHSFSPVNIVSLATSSESKMRLVHIFQCSLRLYIVTYLMRTSFTYLCLIVPARKQQSIRVVMCFQAMKICGMLLHMPSIGFILIDEISTNYNRSNLHDRLQYFTAPLTCNQYPPPHPRQAGSYIMITHAQLQRVVDKKFPGNV